MSRSRLFIAASLTSRMVDAATRLQQVLAATSSSVKWVSPSAIHLTLIFLGDVDDRELHGMFKVSTKALSDESPFTVKLAGVGAFPSLRRPKVIWAGLSEGGEVLIRVHGKLETALEELGCYRREDRPYTPHVTLGRAKEEAANEQLSEALEAHQIWSGGECTLRELGVYSSVLTRNGPDYTLLGRIPLGQ